jgi:hypothetical protein
MDFLLSEENFMPELWYGRLHAVCFLLAYKLTEIENNINTVSKAVEAQAAGLMYYGQFMGPELLVPVEDIQRGIEAVLARREALMGVVGGYAEKLGMLGGEVNGDGGEVQAEQPAHKDEGLEVATADLLAEEVIDFDTYQEPEI